MGGRARSTWVVSREGAAAKSIPYCYLLTSMLLRQLPNNKSTSGECAGHLYSWWHSASPANRERSHDFTLSSSPNAILGHSSCWPMATGTEEVWLVYPVHVLIWYALLVDSGPRISLPFLVDLPLRLEIYKILYHTLPAWIPSVILCVYMQNIFIYLYVYLDNFLFTCDDLEKLKVGTTIIQSLMFCRHISPIFNKLHVCKLFRYTVI